MGDDTFRVLAALRELDDETDEAPSPPDVASRAAVSIGVAERELEALDGVDAADRIGEDDEQFEPADLPVEEVARRVDTVDELDTERRSALLAALQRGDVDPGDVLYDIHDARDAADRAAGSESAG